MTQATLSAPPSPQTARRLVCFPTNVTSPNNFGLLRLALAVLVIFSHSFIAAKGNGHDALFYWGRMEIDTGAIAVNWFFTISGFLIASSWEQTGSFLAYIRKRVLRIFPGLIVAVLFCIFVVGPLAGAHPTTYFRNPETYRFAQILLLRDAFSVNTLPGVFNGNFCKASINGSLWTIRYEFLCYLLIPLLALCGLLRRRSILLSLFLGLLVAFHHFANGFNIGVLFHGDAPITNTLPMLPRLVLFFLAGVTFYAWRDRIPRSPLLLILALVAVVISRGHDLRSERLTLSLPLAGTYIIFYAAYAKSLFPSLTRLAQKHDLSYGVYMFGWPVQQLIVHYAQIGHMGFLLTPMGLFFSAVPLSMGLALLSWNYVEKPFMKLKTARRAQPVSEPVTVLNAPALTGVA